MSGQSGRSPSSQHVVQSREFARWFGSLRDARAKGRILARIRRLSIGHFGDVKSVGGGVHELRIDYGPGYRVYFARRGRSMILLAIGGDKSGQKPILCVRAKSRPHGSPRMGIETIGWDAAAHLDSTEAVLAYLEAVFEDGDPGLIAAALNDVARARGLDGGVLTARTDLASVIKTLKAFGLELTAKAA